MRMVFRMKLKCGVFIHFLIYTLVSGQNIKDKSKFNEQFKLTPTVFNYLDTAADIIKDSNERIRSIAYLRQENSNHASFEVGYLMFMAQERYRRMVDQYNNTFFKHVRDPNDYPENKLIYYHPSLEQVHMMEDIEHHYWELDHIVNMIHEIERKYAIYTKPGAPYVSAPAGSQEHVDKSDLEKRIIGMLNRDEGPTIPTPRPKRTTKNVMGKEKMPPLDKTMSPAEKKLAKEKWQKKQDNKREEFLVQYMQHLLHATTTRSSRWWWRYEYGWEIEHDAFA